MLFHIFESLFDDIFPYARISLSVCITVICQYSERVILWNFYWDIMASKNVLPNVVVRHKAVYQFKFSQKISSHTQLIPVFVIFGHWCSPNWIQHDYLISNLMASYKVRLQLAITGVAYWGGGCQPSHLRSTLEKFKLGVEGVGLPEICDVFVASLWKFPFILFYFIYHFSQWLHPIIRILRT